MIKNKISINALEQRLMNIEIFSENMYNLQLPWNAGKMNPQKPIEPTVLSKLDPQLGLRKFFLFIVEIYDPFDIFVCDFIFRTVLSLSFCTCIDQWLMMTWSYILSSFSPVGLISEVPFKIHGNISGSCQF